MSIWGLISLILHVSRFFLGGLSILWSTIHPSCNPTLSIVVPPGRYLWGSLMGCHCSPNALIVTLSLCGFPVPCLGLSSTCSVSEYLCPIVSVHSWLGIGWYDFCLPYQFWQWGQMAVDRWPCLSMFFPCAKWPIMCLVTHLCQLGLLLLITHSITCRSSSLCSCITPANLVSQYRCAGGPFIADCSACRWCLTIFLVNEELPWFEW